MSRLNATLSFAPAIPVRLPAWPLRARAELLARWQAGRLARARSRTLATLDRHARHDLGLPAEPPPERHAPGLQLLARVGPA